MASDSPQGGNGTRQVALHVNFNDPERLNYVLNNAENILSVLPPERDEDRNPNHRPWPGPAYVSRRYLAGEETSLNLAASQDGLSFYACSNTRERMEKAEGKTLTIMDEASMVSSGIAEIMELQIQGWNYIKP